MKVVALVSGGKDSCYNMVMCQRYGHEVVALANLLPPQDDTDELDSYMYQTVGHQLVASYAECMGLPLYRKRINGHAHNQQLVYAETLNDEVEDLFLLLSYIKQQMPDIQAVSSGAIASDYQRTRVERVCSRLGLVSLGYLWRQPQSQLLHDMIESGIEAILVKVAAAGLVPEKHLGKSLAVMSPQLHKLRAMFGLNVCGEGGEYETLTLDCPLFTQGRIVLEGYEVVVSGPDSMAPVALLHPTKFHVEPKQQQSTTGNGTDGGAGGGNGQVIEVPESYTVPVVESGQQGGAGGVAPPGVSTQVFVTQAPAYVSITAQVDGGSELYASDEGTDIAVTAAFTAVAEQLAALRLTWHDGLFVHLYVPSMASFAAANAAYARFLPAINPPARATVQLAGNATTGLVAEVLFARDVDQRRVLHVQSISEWAPSCIGPYSQAVRHGNLVHFAGQIALDPGSMVIKESTVAAQCRLCIRSCQAVAVAMRVDLTDSMAWCTIYCADAAGVLEADKQLQNFLKGEIDSLVAAKDGNGNGSDEEASSDREVADDDDDDDELDEYLVVSPTTQKLKPCMTYIMVPELPRGALVEVQPVACLEDPTCEVSSTDSDSDSGHESSTPLTATSYLRQGQRTVPCPGGADMHLQCLVQPGRRARVQIELNNQDAAVMSSEAWGLMWSTVVQAVREEVQGAELAMSDVASAKVYGAIEHWEAIQASREALQGASKDAFGPETGIAMIPVTSVGLSTNMDAAFVVEIMVSS